MCIHTHTVRVYFISYLQAFLFSIHDFYNCIQVLLFLGRKEIKGHSPVNTQGKRERKHFLLATNFTCDKCVCMIR